MTTFFDNEYIFESINFTSRSQCVFLRYLVYLATAYRVHATMLESQSASVSPAVSLAGIVTANRRGLSGGQYLPRVVSAVGEQDKITEAWSQSNRDAYKTTTVAGRGFARSLTHDVIFSPPFMERSA